jgi:predicted component of viral defense system (DUF524 family)
MEPLNSGVNLLVWDSSFNSWLDIKEVYLEEAKPYRWKCETTEEIKLTLQQVPLPMLKAEYVWEGVFETPFQSGLITFELSTVNQNVLIETYVYPDGRKITFEQYQLMLQEIIEEATICFQESGLQTNVNASGKSRKLSTLQWNYIEEQIYQLRTLFHKIESRPLQVLKREEEVIKRELIKKVTPGTLSWVERYGESYGSSPTQLPSHMKSTRAQKTYNVYENQIIAFQLNELQSLLQKYIESNNQTIRQKAIQFRDWIMRWRQAGFLEQIKPNVLPIKITQTFRKHPIYRKWYQWFQELNNFKDINMDLKDRLPLKDTYQVYEIWCYMKIVKCLRELDLLADTEPLFTYEDGAYYLHLSKNKDSMITLKNGAKLYYQKVYQNNSNPYYTYTQQMIPDIVLENKGSFYILDPKYRVPANLSMALGEMHKYRDGILNRETDERVVQEVYILTPRKALMSVEKDFYEKSYQDKYRMGAFGFEPGEGLGGFNDWLLEVVS